MPCAVNAANEVANEAFRAGRCGFLDIERVIAGVMDATEAAPVESLGQLAEVDARSREVARSLVDARCA
ncbi:MAG: 1-deoxy-D-xylulose-5-phosphate reductoisomerase, partial [Coriobacteriaceae bacterium]|nr:1-deoxy-D-xylulose-5-phosphate reductoisomerase [Coriobacteriaceae bacterium]